MQKQRLFLFWFTLLSLLPFEGRADVTTDEPLQAYFTTDRAYTSYYTQNFDSKEELAGWTVGKGWKLANKKFSAVDANDKYSIAIGYNDGDGTSSLVSPAIEVRENSVLEFYAYFQAILLYFGKWQLNAVDTKTGESTTLFDAFSWAQDNAYTGPNWNKFELPLNGFAGKSMKFELVYLFGGEDLAIDGFCLKTADAAAEEAIHLFEGESISFVDMSTGSPDNILWTFEGGTPATSTVANPIVTYNQAGTYSVTLTAYKDGKESTVKRNDFVVVTQKVPTAIIGLPEEGYMSPFVGVFIPTNVPVTFRDLSTGNPTSWLWKFQNTDVEESKEQNPTVTYIKKSTTSVGLIAANNAGSSNDILQYAIQAGGAQYVWNISPDENQNIDKVSLGWYGNYAGSNWLGIDRFAERYQTPLADATIDSVAVFFATTTTVSPDAEITLSVNSVSDNGQPGNELASTSLKASELKYDDKNVVATIFKFSETVNIDKGQEFFITIGPFPNATMEESPYTSDDIAIYCVRRGEGKKNTAWQYLEDQDDYGQGLGTYQWFENTDDPLSMAIAPVITYDKPGTDGMTLPTIADKVPVAYYNLGGQRISKPQSGIYIVRYSDGSSEKRTVRN